MSISSALRFLACLLDAALVFRAELGAVDGRVFPDAGGVACADALEEVLHRVEAGLVGHARR